MIRVDGGQMGVGWTWCERLGTPRGAPYCSGQLTGPLLWAAMHCSALQCSAILLWSANRTTTMHCLIFYCTLLRFRIMLCTASHSFALSCTAQCLVGHIMHIVQCTSILVWSAKRTIAMHFAWYFIALCCIIVHFPIECSALYYTVLHCSIAQWCICILQDDTLLFTDTAKQSSDEL